MFVCVAVPAIAIAIIAHVQLHVSLSVVVHTQGFVLSVSYLFLLLSICDCGKAYVLLAACLTGSLSGCADCARSSQSHFWLLLSFFL